MIISKCSQMLLLIHCGFLGFVMYGSPTFCLEHVLKCVNIDFDMLHQVL